MTRSAPSRPPAEPARPRLRRLPAWAKPAAHTLFAMPAVWLLYGWWVILRHDPASLILSAEPIAYTHNGLGLMALRCLVVGLAITPLVRLTGWRPLTGLRRLTGLWAFAYAAVHLAFYLAMELDFSLTRLLAEAAAKPFIFAGLVGFLAMAPLAATSTAGAIRRLGARRWQRLHRLAYLAALAGAVHFFFRVKGIQPEPLFYIGLVLALLGLRLLPEARGPGGWLGALTRPRSPIPG